MRRPLLLLTCPLALALLGCPKKPAQPKTSEKTPESDKTEQAKTPTTKTKRQPPPKPAYVPPPTRTFKLDLKLRTKAKGKQSATHALTLTREPVKDRALGASDCDRGA